MLAAIQPKLPMRNKTTTVRFYTTYLGFSVYGDDYPNYLMLERDGQQIHFFEHQTLDPSANYGQVYIRTKNIENLYASLLANGCPIHPNGALQNKPWRQKEFAVSDPDNNLLTFGESSE
jgi:hypothetical protein